VIEVLCGTGALLYFRSRVSLKRLKRIELSETVIRLRAWDINASHLRGHSEVDQVRDSSNFLILKNRPTFLLLLGLSTGSYILNELISLKKAGRVDELIVLGRSSASDAARTAEASAKGVQYYPVTYTDEAAVSAILKKHGIECVVSTLALSDVSAIKISEPALVRASASAGVKRFLPSQYGTDITPEYDRRETREVNERKGAVIKEIERVGMEWSVVATCGFELLVLIQNDS